MSNSAASSTADDLWINAGLTGNRVCLSRMISVVENNAPELSAVLAAAYLKVRKAIRVGITGVPGVGKSCLVSSCIKELRKRDLTVGVLLVDPSSGATGGAVLGDRVRMPQERADPGLFIRSMAARGQLGGLVASAMLATDVLDACGFDVIIIETVGVGQSEIDIADIAHCTVVVTAPGLGDDVQGIKSGILEIADILVLNKADLANAKATVRQMKNAAHFAANGSEVPPVLETIATSGLGVPELVDAVNICARAVLESQSKHTTLPIVLKRLANMLLTNWSAHSEAEIGALSKKILDNDLSIDDAVRELVSQAAQSQLTVTPPP